jgi:hypothetical protein
VPLLNRVFPGTNEADARGDDRSSQKGL